MAQSHTTGYFTVTRKGLVPGTPSDAFVRGVTDPHVTTGWYAMVPQPKHVAEMEAISGHLISVRTASGDNAPTILRKICRNFKNSHEIFVLEFSGTPDRYQIIKIGMMRK